VMFGRESVISDGGDGRPEIATDIASILAGRADASTHWGRVRWQVELPFLKLAASATVLKLRLLMDNAEMLFPGVEDIALFFHGAGHDLVAEDLNRQAETFGCADLAA
jgi:hypothetical protein